MDGGLERILRTRPLASLCGCVVLGVAAGLGAPERGMAFLALGAALGCACALLCAKRRRIWFAALLSAAMFCSAGYAAWRAVPPAAGAVRGARVYGIVADAPEWQADVQRAVMRLKDVQLDGGALPCDVRAYVYGEGARAITIGDAFEATTNVYAPDTGRNGGFDFAAYLWTEGVGNYISLPAEQVELEARDGGLLEAVSALRRALQDRFDALFPQNAPLLRALLLGDRSAVSEDQLAEFTDAGIMHLLAVSGLHVTTLAMAIQMLMQMLCVPRSVSTALTAALLAGYALLCGMSPSVVRAALMYCVMMGGKLSRRPNDLITRLALACALMLMWNPMYLTQAGFGLSFSAVAGLALLYPTLQQGYAHIARPDGRVARRILDRVAQGVLAGIAVLLASLPVTLAAFGRVTWTTLLLNLPCIPLANFALVFGLLAAVFGGLIPPLASIADAFAGVLSAIASWAAGLPFGNLTIPKLTLLTCLLYVLLTALGSCALRSPLWRRLTAIALLPALAMLNAAGLEAVRNAPGLSAVFLDVGQGDGALIHTGGCDYLVDVGLDDGTVAEYIEDSGADVRAIFLSHAHDDHVGGLEQVLAVCHPEAIYLPEGFSGDGADDEAMAEIDAARASGVEVRTLSAGDEVRLSGDAVARVLAPESGADLDGDNDASMLLCVSCGDGAILFTGDMEFGAEPDVVPDCSVLKVAHHGSGGASSSRFLAMARPELAVISVGEGNSYGHPAQEALDRLAQCGAQVMRTDWDGMVTVWLGSDGTVRARAERQRGGDLQ